MKRYYCVFFRYYLTYRLPEELRLLYGDDDDPHETFIGSRRCDVDACNKEEAEKKARLKLHLPEFQKLEFGEMNNRILIKDLNERQKKMIDLTNVEATQEFSKLPVGGYVCVIMKAEDNEAEQYVNIVYDIAEGDKTGFYSSEDDWRHSTRKYYKGKAAGMFKGFIETLAKDNQGMDAQSVIQGKGTTGMIGCKFGALIQERYYTGNDGTDKTALEVAQTVSCEKIRNNDFTLPKPRDNRNKDNVTVEAVNAGDIPFL